MRDDAFRRGDLVEVKSPSEILATLDDRGALASLPFMPEMLQYCGRRFVVDGRAEKLCDTIHPIGCQRLPDAVLLKGPRCDGAGHDECQSECRLFWKSSWLRRVGLQEPPAPAAGDGGAARAALAQLLVRNTKTTAVEDGRPVDRYRCQATELARAARPVGVRDPRPYLRELISGNVPLGRFLRVLARGVVEKLGIKLHLLSEVALAGPGAAVTEPPLNLQPGEWVQVKTRKEIAETLGPGGSNRGLSFDREMLPHCGKIFRVRRRIQRIIDDRTGRVIELKSDCATLEGVVCSGDLSLNRWFCPRQIYPFWRECWLRRVEPPISTAERSGATPPGPTSAESRQTRPIRGGAVSPSFPVGRCPEGPSHRSNGA